MNSGTKEGNNAKKVLFNRIIAIVCVIALLFAGGVGGFLYKGFLIKKEFQGKPNVRIALVNQDQGTDRGTNYSTELIKTIEGDTYQVVSYEAAKTGLKNGTYAAVMIFPSDLSKKVSRIDAKNVECVELQYAMSDNLTEKQYVDAYQKVFDANKLFNARLSNAFISSIFSEVRKGQGNVDAIFEINQKDLNAAQNLFVPDFMKNIDYSDIPQANIDLQSLNLGNYEKVNSNSEFAEDVRELFDNGYKTAYDNNKTNIFKRVSELESNYTALESYYYDLRQDSDTLSSYNAEYTSFVEDFTNGLPQMQAPDIAPLDPILENEPLLPNVVNDPTSEYYQDPVAYNKYLMMYRDALNARQKNLNNVQQGLQNDWKATNDFLLIKKNQADSFANLNKNLNLNIKNSTSIDSYKDIKTNIEENKGNVTDSLNTLNPSNVAATILKTTDSQKIPLKEALDMQEAGFNEQLRALNEDINNMQNSNNTQLNSAYAQYNTHVGNVHAQSLKGYSDAQAALADAVSSFASLKQANSDKTAEHLEMINKLLTYDNPDNTTSTKVIDFIVEPLVLVEVEM